MNDQDESLRFSLPQLFLLTTAASLLFGTGQLLGTFLTSLLLGLLVIGVVISLLSIESLILGGLLGAVLAVVILLVAILLDTFQAGNMLGFKSLNAMLLYPPSGYMVGLFCTADKTMDSN